MTDERRVLILHLQKNTADNSRRIFLVAYKIAKKSRVKIISILQQIYDF